MIKTIKASFGADTIFTKTAKVFQWDRGDRLEFVNLDLPQYYEVHFANSLSGEAVRVIADGNSVEIPPDLFVPGSEIYAWVWISSETGGFTRCQVTIPISKKARPSDIQPTPSQQDEIDQAITLLNEALETQITPEEKAKLAGIEAGAEVNKIEHLMAFEPDSSGMDGEVNELRIVDKTVLLPNWSQVASVFFTLTCDDYTDPFNITESGLRVTSGPRWSELYIASEYLLCRGVATLAGGSKNSYVLRLTCYNNGPDEIWEFTGRTEDGWEIRIHTPNPFSDPLNHWEVETFNASDRIDEVDEGVYTNSLEIGNIDELTTTDKSSLVAAINEVAGSSGGGAFWATFEVTPFADIVAAHNAGKAVFLKDDGGQIYSLDFVATHYVTFSAVGASGTSVTFYVDGYLIKVTDEEVWVTNSGAVALKSDVNAKYTKPSGGIPSSDMASAVQTSLGKADSAYQKPSGGIPASDLASGVIPTVPAAETSNPSALGTASPGSSTKWARGDHVHPKPTPADIGAGTYSKPSGGIPASDLASAVQASLGKADSALQTETDPTVPSWAKESSKPSYSASEVGAIAAPESPTSGDVLAYDGSKWGAAAPAHQVPSGGNAGECLAKNSASDYDLRWRTINDWTPAGLMRTAGGTAAKVAEWSFWSDAQSPAWLVVTVGNSNTYAGAITLKVNGKGPYPIYINGAASSATNYSLPAGSYFVYFDGTKFDFRTDGKIPGDITGHADQDIAAPASPTTGDFLCWNGSAWAATTLAAWQGGNY